MAKKAKKKAVKKKDAKGAVKTRVLVKKKGKAAAPKQAKAKQSAARRA